MKARRFGWLPALFALALSGCNDSYVSYNHDGVLLTQGQGKPSAERGAWTFRYFDGSLRARGSYDSQGRREGVWETFFRNGHRESRGERVWDAESHGSLRAGPWTFWHENGFQRSQGTYSKGLREGPWIFTTPEGAPDTKQTGLYREGVLVPSDPAQNPTNNPSGSE